MAVYTEVGDADLEELLKEFDLGSVLSFKGIAEGVENSNFLLRTEAGSFILTLYEKRVAEQDLPFFLGLMEHLAERGIRCPLPVKAGYSATVQVTDKGNGTCNVNWSSTFEPKGAPEADAVKVVEGIYRGGIAGARKRVEG